MTTILRLLFCGALLGASSLIAADSAATPAATDTAPKRWRFERMRPPELEEALRTQPLAWLVISPLEWHGEAIAFCSDPLVGQTVAERAWEQVGGVLIPTLYIGCETQYKEWDVDKGLVTRWGMELISREHNPGSLYVRPITLELVLVDYLDALQREGFKHVVVVTGHGGYEHVQIIREVCARNRGDMKTMVWGGGGGVRHIPEHLRLKQVEGASHANIGEASRVGGIDPTLVDVTQFGVRERDRKTGLLSENAAEINFEKGRGLVEYSGDALAAKVREFIEQE